MIKDYLKYIREVRNLSENTVSAYKSDLQDFVKFGLSTGLRWSTLTERDIDGWLMSLTQRGDSPKTRNRKLASLRGLLTWAHHKGILTTNPARFCQAAKTGDALPKMVSIKGIDNYLQNRKPSTRSNITALLTVIMLESGLRISEALALKTQDIDPNERRLTVTGKGGKQRICYYGERTAREISTWWTPAEGYLFPQWNAKSYRTIIEEELRPYVGKMTPHALRHTFATAYLNQGMPIETLQLLLGHKKIETTQIYARVAQATAKAQAEKFRF